jgi:signal transduction histidine kinase
MSKIEAGQATLKRETFDLPSMLSELEPMFRMRAEAKRLELKFVQSGDLPRFVQTDAGKLRQVLINLIGNAVKFTEHGGVTVRSAVEQRNGWRLLVEVEDTGPGISAEERTRLFRRFEQTSVGRPALIAERDHGGARAAADRGRQTHLTQGRGVCGHVSDGL